MRLKPTLKLRSHKENIPVSRAFADVVQEAIAVTQELNKLTSPTWEKLTAEAFLAETIEADASCDLASVTTLHKAINAGGAELSHCWRTRNRMVKALRDGDIPRPPTPKAIARLGSVHWLSDASTEAELIKFGSGIVELFGSAVMVCAEKHPETFGLSKSTAVHAEQVEELRAKQATLFAQISATVTGDDLETDEKEWSRPPTFKLSKGAIPLSPKQDAGARLVRFLLEQRAAKN